MMALDPKLIEYLKTSLAQSRSKEDMYKELLSQGWTIEMIQASFNSIGAEQHKDDTSKKTIRIIVTIGAVLVGAGIFSFIAANWFSMAKPLKIVIILFSMVVAYGAGWYLKEKLKLQKTGDALILLGCIMQGWLLFSLVLRSVHFFAEDIKNSVMANAISGKEFNRPTA